MKKRSLALLMVLMMLITLVTPTVFAEENDSLAKYREKYLSLEKGTYSAQSDGPVVDLWTWPGVVTRGDTFTLEIGLGNITDLYGASVDLKFDSSILEVVEYDGKPVNDSWNVFMENGTDGIDVAQYVNEYDKDDPSIIHYAVGRLGDVSGFDINDWGVLGAITFRVKDDALIPNGVEFKVSDLIDDLDNGNANVIVKLSDSNEQPIVYDSYGNSVYIYDVEDANGEIRLDWSVTSELDLDAHFLVTEDMYNSYEVYYGNRGVLHEFPKAILLNDDRSDEWNDFTASEKMLYNELIPGSEFAVNLYGDGDLSSIDGDITVTLDVYSIDNYSTPITFDIKDAEGSGVWWHVFEVRDDDNDGVVEIVPINEINNVDPWGNTGGGYYDPYIEITSDNFWGNSDTQDITVTGNVIDMVDGYNTLEVEINGTTSTVTINADGSFSVPLTLQPGANFVTLKYVYGDNDFTSTSSVIYYDTFYVRATPTYDFENRIYSGDLELEISKKRPINADFDTQTQIYGELYKVNWTESTLDYIADLTFNLNEDKYRYTTVTNGISFSRYDEYFMKFYSDDAKQNFIGYGRFGIFPIIITSDNFGGTVNTQTITITGFLAFVDDLLASDNYSLKAYVNEDPYVDPGTEIIDIDANGNFSVDIALQPGDNYVKIRLERDNYGSWSTSNHIYYQDNTGGEIPAPTIIPLAQQSDSIWHDGVITISELNAIPGEYPDVPLEFNLPDGVGTGDRDSNTGVRTGYWKHVKVYDQNNNYVYGTMSRIYQDEVDSRKATQYIPADDLLDRLIPGETYLLYAQIENIDNGSMSELSPPVAFTYEDDSTQLSSDATLSSSVYTVDNGNETITNIPYGTDLATFKNNLTPAAGATFEVYESDGTTVASDLQTGYKVVVTAEDGVTTKVYTVTVDEETIKPTITVGSATVLRGKQFTIPVTIDQIPADWISFDAILSYDKSKLTYVSHSNGDVFAQMDGNNDETNGEFVVSVATDYPWTSGSKLFEITFMVNGDAELGNTPITLISDELILGNTDFNIIPINIVNGSVNIINVIYGDVTGDGKINAMDAAAILRYKVRLYNLNSEQIIAADVTGDGKVNAMDAAAILRFKVGLLDKFPVEN